MALVKYNNNSISAVTAAASIPNGALTHIKTLTASSSATLSFVHGTDGVVLDSTYPIYKFVFIDIHPSSDGANFQVNFRDGDTAYDAVKTTTAFGAYHNESDSGAGLAYDTGKDLAQSTAAQKLDAQGDTGANDDQSGAGELTLFNPSSTTFVKHFIARLHNYNITDYSIDSYTAGYCNVTAAIDGVQFSYSSGNIDAGKIKLYGIKDS
jgi:hypothetical protein